MDPRIADKLLDQIVELSQGNEERMMEFLAKASSGAERQRRSREKKLSAGLRPNEVWTSPEELEALRQRFPGKRGGVDWRAAVFAALGKTPPEGSDP